MIVKSVGTALSALVLSVLWANSLVAQTVTDAARHSSISNYVDCTIGSDAATLPAQCATVTVPLDYDNPAAGTIELRLARLAAKSQDSGEDPFTLIAGGPGQSATETFPGVSFAFRHIRQTRDIILLDQRGTGESNRLNCPTTPEQNALEFNAEHVQMLARECVAQLDVDTRFFTTSVAVRDLETVRTLLGARQWNIYGISYGTRVALHYLRRYPEHVRTLIVDAVVPPEVSLGPAIPELAQRALDKIFDRCAEDPGCNAAFPDVATRTLELIASLKDAPRSIEYEDIGTGQLRSIEFTDQHLAITLRLMSYSAHGAAILPSMLHDAIENEHFAPLARQAQIQTESLTSTLATGMQNAVICTEDAAFIDEHSVASSNPEERPASYLGYDLLQALSAGCKEWPAGVLDDDFKQAVIADNPVLILSGDADPITPPAYGDQIAAHLPNSRHIVNAHQGHMQSPLGCMPLIMTSFIETANSHKLNIDCLDRMQAPAFFVDANGPLP